MTLKPLRWRRTCPYGWKAECPISGQWQIGIASLLGGYWVRHDFEYHHPTVSGTEADAKRQVEQRRVDLVKHRVAEARLVLSKYERLCKKEGTV